MATQADIVFITSTPLPVMADRLAESDVHEPFTR
jgi:hypothetical protein